LGIDCFTYDAAGARVYTLALRWDGRTLKRYEPQENGSIEWTRGGVKVGVRMVEEGGVGAVVRRVGRKVGIGNK